MKYAVLNNKRIEPQKGIKGAICPICGEFVIPKCGEQIIHHWAHKSNANCDPWWESETEWHRQWKDNFAKECQEIILYDDKTGEKHVADVKTKTGIILEFQHSPMNIKEQYSREQFYKNMVWVVDARTYYDKFKQNIKLLEHCKSNKNYFYIKIDSYEKQNICFPKRWLEASVPVIFDFGINDDIEDYDYNMQKKWLWCVFPEKFTKNLGYWFDETICGIYLKKETFVNRVSNFDSFYPNIVIPELEQLKEQIEKEKLEQEKKRQEEWKKQEELHKQQQQELFKIKYPKEEKWRDAIFNIKLDIKNGKLNPKKLYISDEGEILDKDKQKYNGFKCMVLGINSYPSVYNGNKYTKNDVLMLIERDNTFTATTIYIPSQILHGYSLGFDLLGGNYNYYMRIMTVFPYYDKFSIWFEDEERIWTTEKLKKDLDFICNSFKNF